MYRIQKAAVNPLARKRQHDADEIVDNTPEGMIETLQDILLNDSLKHNL